MKMSKTMIAMVVVLALSGMVAILEVRGRAAARGLAPEMSTPATGGQTAPDATPAAPPPESRSARPGRWIG